MNKLIKRVVIGLTFLAALIAVQASLAQTLQAVTLTLTGPSSCPSVGCAAGQSLDFRASFDLTQFDPALSPNVQLCVFTPQTWQVDRWSIDSVGKLSGTAYLTDTSNCPAAPTGYGLTGGVSAQQPAGIFGDVLNFSFRIQPTTAGRGTALVMLSQQSSSGWGPGEQSFVDVPVIPKATDVYAANDASACGSFSPCYLNSASDQSDGFGTGLKDAVDTGAAAVTVLGNYQVKSKTVLIDKSVTIKGLEDSRITYFGTQCNEPVLKLTAGATLRDLTITDGTCTPTNRDLVTVDSPQDVTIEYVDLLAGLDALKIADNAGNVSLRFSQAMNNTGYAVFRVPKIAGGALQISGSNLYGNRSGAQVDCGNAGSVDHNFWGFGVPSSTATSQCASIDTKQLGAPVLPRSGAAGVNGEKVTVTTTRQASFSGLIAYQRSPEGSDFTLNIVNHGAGTPENVPFTGGEASSLVPCSNYYDLFLENGSTAGGTLNLSLKFDRTAGCTTTIKTTAYCASTDPIRFPLYWYSPFPTAPSGWNTTGATGQSTTCDMVNNEIMVAIDTSGRPNFGDDLNFTPFVVGLPSQPSSVVITRLEAIPGVGQAAVQWTTASEVNTSGFYVLRSLTESGGFERVSLFIPRKGGPSTGANYEYIDSGLTNNVRYYYRLEIISTGLGSSYSQVVSALIGQPTNTATVTSTVTLTQTQTQTVTPTGPTPTSTITMTRTITRTVTPTRLPTRTRTPIRYATYFIYRSPTPRPTRTLFPTRTATPTATLSRAGQTATARALNPLSTQPLFTITGTQLASVDSTPPATLGTQTEGSGSGYPPPEGTQVSQHSTFTTSPEKTSAPPPSDTSAPSEPQELGWLERASTVGSRNWKWLLGLLIFELATVGVAGVYLHKHNRLILPWKKKDEAPPPET